MILVDTNVLVYSLDGRDPQKQEAARTWLRYIRNNAAGALSVQCLSELANVCLNRLQPRMTAEETAGLIDDFASAFRVLHLTPAVVTEAIRGVSDHRLAYFDSQIWATARLNQFSHVLTEDVPGKERIEGVTFVNPFESPPPGTRQDELA